VTPPSSLDGDGDGFATACGAGVCAVVGQCVAGIDDCVPGSPGGPEACDALDNDCNGPTDEDLPCAATELFCSGDTVSWNPVVGALVHDLVWGRVSQLRLSGGDYSLATDGCAGAAVPGTSVEFTTLPDPGDALWVVARPRNENGFGTYDDAPGGGPGQDGLRDAEIDRSPNACP